MKKMFLEELIDMVIVVKLSTTLLKILDPVEIYIPNFWQEILLYLTILYISDIYTGSVSSANTLLERYRHKPDIAVS